MQGFFHYRFISSFFAGIAALGIVAFQFYLSVSTTQAENTEFAKELKLSGVDIIQQANSIISANPIEPEPMIKEQQLAIKKSAAELDKEIEQLDQQNELVKIKKNNYKASALISVKNLKIVKA